MGESGETLYSSGWGVVRRCEKLGAHPPKKRRMPEDQLPKSIRCEPMASVRGKATRRRWQMYNELSCGSARMYVT